MCLLAKVFVGVSGKSPCKVFVGVSKKERASKPCLPVGLAVVAWNESSPLCATESLLITSKKNKNKMKCKHAKVFNILLLIKA